MKNLLKVFQKQTKKKHEETEFHNSIQDWVFTAVDQLQQSPWKNAWIYGQFEAIQMSDSRHIALTVIVTFYLTRAEKIMIFCQKNADINKINRTLVYTKRCIF